MERLTVYNNFGVANFKLNRFDQAYAAFSRSAALLSTRYRDRAASGSDQDARTALAEVTKVYTSQVSAAWALAHQP